METHKVEEKNIFSTNTLKNFVLSNQDKIRLVDTDEETGLELYCYNQCAEESEELVKQSKGLVFHGENLIMKAFSYTPEYSLTNPILEQLLTNFSDWHFFTSYEGTLLRLFYFSGKWFLSTNRKLNAFRSKWASKESFGTLFKRALEREEIVNSSFSSLLTNREGDSILERFQNSLDTKKQYMFLLRNCSENRIVSDNPDEKESLVYHVGTFINGELSISENIGIRQPYSHKFPNLESLLEYIVLIPYKKAQGIVCFGKNNTQIKILNDEYLKMLKIRGNEPSIKFRYLQLRLNKEWIDVLYKLYPEFSHLFDDYENTIYDIARNIYRAYVQRFIKKNYVTMPREEYEVMNECHNWHLLDREKNKINLDRVIQILNKQTPTNLNHMIRRFKIEQTKKQSTVPRTVKGSRNNSPLLLAVEPNLSLLKSIAPPKLN